MVLLLVLARYSLLVLLRAMARFFVLVLSDIMARLRLWHSLDDGYAATGMGQFGGAI